MKQTNVISTKGNFTIEPKLKDYDLFYLINFHETPHFKRNPDKLKEKFDRSQSLNGDYGVEGELFIRNAFAPAKGRTKLHKIGTNQISFNELYCIDDKDLPAGSCPSINCSWGPTIDGTKLVNKDKNGERKYQWLKWLVNNFFKKYNYTLNGEFKIYDSVTNNTRIVEIVNNIIKVKIKERGENEVITDEKTKTLKTDDKILNDIIYKTENGLIHWKKNDKFKNHYVYKYPVTEKKSIQFMLILRPDRKNLSHISVSMISKTKASFMRTLKGYKVANLGDIIKEKAVEY